MSWTGLHVATFEGNLEQVIFLVEKKGHDPHPRIGGWTPLHRAAMKGHQAIVEYLVDNQRCDPNCTHSAGWTPLHNACLGGHQVIVEYLIDNCKKQCDPNYRDVDGKTPLHYACGEGYQAIAEYLIDKKHCDPNCRDYYGWTPLHYACRNGHQAVVEYLVDSKCDPNCKDNAEETPLHLACREGYDAVVEYLIDKKQCDPNCKDNIEETPLHHACGNGHQTIVKYLIDKKQCDPNCKDINGETPLHYACRNGFQATVEYLIDRKQCAPNCRDNKGGTPLHLSCWKGHQMIVEYLIDKKLCNPKSQDNAGETPLHRACRGGHQAIMEYLVEQKGCEPNCITSNGLSLLHYACWNGNQAIVEYLVDKKHCDPNCRDKDGWTPLHRACWNNHYEVVCYLLPKCDPNIVTNDGHTPLTLTSDVAIIKELISVGARAEIAGLRYLPGSYSKKPASSVVKTFIFGDPEAGKTTLIEALKSESSGIFSNVFGRLFRVEKSKERTAGIVPHHIESRSFGCVSFYDFAGHREFYASHDVLLQSSVSGETSVYLIVVDMSKNDEEIRKTVLYWLSFIGNQKKASKQHVIIVGSHADQVHSKEEKSHKAAVIDSISTSKSFTNLHFAGFVSLDCRYAQTESMSMLRQKLRQSYRILKNTVRLQMKTHCFLMYLLEKNPYAPAITLGSVLTGMEREKDMELISYFPHDIGQLVEMCEELSARGNILFFNNSDSPVDSTIVLDQVILFSRVTGTVFAPESFKQHAALASSTGVVPYRKLVSQFPKLDSNMIIEFMCHLEFCHEVTDPEVLQLLQADSVVIGEEERFFFFPGLVSIQAPSRVWEHTNRFLYHCGWQLQCTQSEHFLTPRFLQVLILRLAFSFALAPHSVASNSEDLGKHEASCTKILTMHRRCTVWKNGIYWANRYGAEALVEVSTDSKRVTVLIRCRRGCVAAASELRSGVIQKVLMAKQNFCSTISCYESLLDSSYSLLYPCSKSTIGVPISTVAETIVHSGHCIVHNLGTVELEELLGFEPYATFDKMLLNELFDEESEHYNEPIKDEFIYRIARKAFPVRNLFIEMLALDHPDMLENLTDQGRDGAVHLLARAIQLWRGDYCTIHHLREKLDKFSIFAGRNPLTIIHRLPTRV